MRLEVDQEDVTVGDTVTFSVLHEIKGAADTGTAYSANYPSDRFDIRVAAGTGAQEYPPTGTPLLDSTAAANTGFLIDIDPGDITGGVPVLAWLLEGSTVVAGTVFWAKEAA